MKVSELWRYPVKSMGGEKLTSAVLSHHGIRGDRSYAVHDGKTIRGAKKFAALMNFDAAFDEEPDGVSIPAVSITLNNSVNSEDAGIDAFISRELGTDVSLHRLRPADDLDYFRKPEEKLSGDDIRGLLGLLPDEPFPDFSEFPEELSQYASPPGTFFDAYPLLILTTASLRALQTAAAGSKIDVRRFRPNIVLDTDGTGYQEENWKGKYLKIGAAIIELTLPCPRCVMTTIGFSDLPKAPGIMRTLVQENHHKLGIYAGVVKPGKIDLSDEVELLDSYE